MAASVASVEPRLRVLLVEDNPGDAELVVSALAGASTATFEILKADRLSEALDLLAESAFDAVLLDLSLPDCQGLPTFARLHAHRRALPVVVLTAFDDEGTAVTAVRLGAQDYLVKGRWDDESLVRSLRYAVARSRILIQLEQALGNLRSPSSLVRLCAWCRKVRDDEGGWLTVEDYLARHYRATPTHGICPECSDHLEET